MNRIRLLIGCWLCCGTLLAQLNDGGSMPVSFGLHDVKPQQVPTWVAPALDMKQIQAEDAESEQKGELYRFGRIIPVSNISLQSGGSWQTLRNGDRIWRVRLESKNAEALSLFFENFYLPKGARLHIYAADKTHLIGGFGNHNNHESGQFATELVMDDAVVVEYYEPVYVHGQGRFTISGLGHAYRSARNFGDSGSCEVNVNCPEGTGRTSQRNAVARVQVAIGAVLGWCSGTMVNNTSQNCTPYLLTAMHCSLDGTTVATAANLNNWVFYYNFQGAACTNPGTQPTSVTATGCTRRAHSNDNGGATGSDFLLVQLNSTPSASANIFYAGWDRNNTAASGAYGIHHPAGDIKKISTVTATITSTSWGGSTPNTHWQTLWARTVTNWGVTEGGSSGSGLFNSSNRVVGTLTGGGSDCANQSAADAYGKLAYHWTSNANSATSLGRLKDWLDPTNTGATTLDGVAAPCVASTDAGIASIVNPANGAYICTNPFAPQVVLQNFGTNTITSVTINYRISPNVPSTFAWTGSLASGATTTVTLPNVTATPNTVFTFQAYTTNPNGGADATPANDTSIAVSQYTTTSVLPYSEAFNAGSIPANIDLYNPNADTFVWEYANGISAFGSGTGSIMFDNYNGTGASNPAGKLDWFFLPDLDFTGQSSPQLRYDVAYARYNATYNDTLLVVISTDCGNTYNIISQQGGTTLATAPDQTTMFTPTAAQWVTKTINLSAYANLNRVSIAFINYSGYSNRLFIDNINIPSACAMTATIPSSTNVTCNGTSTGSATATVTGGTAPINYLWSNGRTTAANTGLAAGTYTVTATDALGCSSTRSVTITQPSAVTATVASQVNVACFGGNTGTFTIAGAGGTGAYQFNRGTGNQTSGTFTGLAAGSYLVSVTDANSCVTTVGVTLTQPSSLTLSTSAQTNVSCNGGSNGSFTITATGGTAAYQFNRGTGNQASGTFSGLIANNYLVTVTDANGCIATRSVTITQPATSLAASLSSQTNIGCFGASTGSFTIGASGGTPSYQFNRGTGNQASGTFSGLAAGAYTVTVTDANGCTTTQAVNLTQPASGISTTVSSQTNVACFGGSTGSFTIGATNGVAPYQYNRGTGNQSTGTFTGLAAGTYIVTVTDNSGCSTTRSVTVTQPSAALVATVASQVNIACFGASTGSFNITASGGTTAYQFNRGTGNQTSGTFTGLPAGTYTVTVTDANGCTTTQSVTLTQPASALAASLSSQTNISCFGGTNGAFTIGASGGTGAYQFNRGTGNQSSGTFSGLAAGSYTVTVTDVNSCMTTVNVTLTQPASALATSVASTTAVACFGGSNGGFTISATGGTASYQFNRGLGNQSSGSFAGLSAGSYTVTVTDANGCFTTQVVNVTQPTSAVGVSTSATGVSCALNDGTATATGSGGTGSFTYTWSNGGNGSTITGLNAGAYTVTVRDANSCSATANAIVGNNCTPCTMTISTTQNNVSCHGACNGAANVTAAGGTTPYQFFWSDGFTTVARANLCAGTYSVTVLDGAGCTASTFVTITEPSALSISTAGGAINCVPNSGSITATTSGGTGATTFFWSNGATTAQITGLAAGTYGVTATDANGCIVAAPLVTITIASSFTFSVFTDAISCAGVNDGVVHTTIVGGQPPFQFAWSNGATTGSISGLGAGVYSVTVSDANGCSNAASATLTAPSALTATATGVNPTSGNNGSASASGAGGTTPYTFAWSNGATSANISGLGAGTYSVTVTDANGCTATDATSLVFVNVAQVDNVQRFVVIPNPNEGQFTIQLELGSVQSGTIRLVDVLGRNLRDMHFEAQTVTIPMDISQQAGGVYFVVLQTANQTITRKVTVAK